MDAIKKRGRTATKTKQTNPAQSAKADSVPGVPVATEPVIGKGKRKTPELAVDNAKVIETKKRRSDEPTLEEGENAELTAPTKGKATKRRPKKNAGETPAVVVKEAKAARVRKGAVKAGAAVAQNGSNAELQEQTNGLAVEETQPAIVKRNRGKPTYKEEEDLDEPEYVPKPSKGRGKTKVTEDTNDEEQANDAVTSKKKPAAKRQNLSKEAAPDSSAPEKPVAKRTSQSKEVVADSSAPTKPSARGRKKALVSEENDNDADMKTVAEVSTNQKPAAKRATQKKKETVSTSSASAKLAARGRKKTVASEAATEVPADGGDEQTVPQETSSNGVTQRKRGKGNADEGQEEADGAKVAQKGKKAKVAAPKMNKCATDYGSINFDDDVKNKQWNFKISSWNVAGLRSWVTKGGLEFLEHERPDILCVQETKCTEDQLPDEARHIPGYHPYWLCKPGGYAGVAIYSKKMPFHVTYGLGDAEQDQDGRLLTAEYEKFYLVCVYVPNAGNKLVTLPKRMRWDEKFHQYLAQLNSKKPVILCGDMNVAHEEIDLANPKTNRKNAGFTQEERDGFTKLLSLGFVDTFRRLYPDQRSAYTFWTYMGGARAKNVGWRLDYFIVSERLVDKVTDNVIRSKVYGSDHCPVTLFLNI